METLSRVKKYEDLRRQIENENLGNDTLPEEKLQSYAQHLNEIDPTLFKKATVQEKQPYVPERERTLVQSNAKEDATTDFKNEYLDDFIKEVREYNIKKGIRENENTQIDILNQLHASQPLKRTAYAEATQEGPKLAEVTQNIHVNRDEIAAQIQDFVKEDTNKKAEDYLINPNLTPFSIVEKPQAENLKTESLQQQEEKKEELPSPFTKLPIQEEPKAISDSIDTLESEKNQIRSFPIFSNVADENNVIKKPKAQQATEVDVKEQQREAKLHQKLVEETQQLRVQLNEYEDDLNDLTEGVEKTNKMLNIILGFLILALLVIIGVIIYWIIQAGGIV